MTVSYKIIAKLLVRPTHQGTTDNIDGQSIGQRNGPLPSSSALHNYYCRCFFTIFSRPITCSENCRNSLKTPRHPSRQIQPRSATLPRLLLVLLSSAKTINRYM